MACTTMTGSAPAPTDARFDVPVLADSLNPFVVPPTRLNGAGESAKSSLCEAMRTSDGSIFSKRVAR